MRLAIEKYSAQLQLSKRFSPGARVEVRAAHQALTPP